MSKFQTTSPFRGDCDASPATTLAASAGFRQRRPSVAIATLARRPALQAHRVSDNVALPWRLRPCVVKSNRALGLGHGCRVPQRLDSEGQFDFSSSCAQAQALFEFRTIAKLPALGILLEVRGAMPCTLALDF